MKVVEGSCPKVYKRTM